MWASNEKREEIVKRRLLTDKNFKLTSLQVNPIYKPIFDKLDALALKELKELDKSVLWSRHYTKQDFKHSFAYPAIVFGLVIYSLISYGVKYRLYTQAIRHDRKLDFAAHLDIDLDDIGSYPASLYHEIQEKKKYDGYIKRKDDKIESISDEFHVFLEKKASSTVERREKRGLKVRKRSSPLEKIKDFEMS